MLEISQSKIRERLTKMFPERQFIHRTGGKVNYFILTPRMQMVIAGMFMVLVIWSMLTFISLLVGKNPFTSTNKELMIKKAQYERYMIDLNAKEQDTREMLRRQQEQFKLAAQDFQNRHNTIVNMINIGGILQDEAPSDEHRYARSEILVAPDIIDVLERQPRIKFNQHTQLQTGTDLDTSMVNLERDQNKILEAGEIKMQAMIEQNRAVLAATGLPLTKILENGMAGMGGPANEIKMASVTLAPGEFLPRTESIKARTYEAMRLQQALASTPLGRPIAAESYVTSSFGKRRDPFTKRPSYHNGIDIASYKLAPIVATAAGKVVFAGKNGGFGLVVVIDHGHGFKTRYAHLEKTFVKRGQKVEKGEKIAGMGSTGRSTSTHLHYEVLFEDRPYNPTKFMKAGNYVQ